MIPYFPPAPALCQWGDHALTRTTECPDGFRFEGLTVRHYTWSADDRMVMGIIDLGPCPFRSQWPGHSMPLSEVLDALAEWEADQ